MPPGPAPLQQGSAHRSPGQRPLLQPPSDPPTPDRTSLIPSRLSGPQPRVGPERWKHGRSDGRQRFRVRKDAACPSRVQRASVAMQVFGAGRDSRRSHASQLLLFASGSRGHAWSRPTSADRAALGQGFADFPRQVSSKYLGFAGMWTLWQRPSPARPRRHGGRHRRHVSERVWP